MTRPLAVTVAIVATLGSCLLQASTASAERVAWNLSVGGPGYAINVGQPGFRGGNAAVLGPRHPGAWRPWHRPAYVPMLPAPFVYVAAPMPAVVGFLPVTYPAPYMLAPLRMIPTYAPRRVVVAAPIMAPPIMAPPRHRHR
jgi:hypothetical protein